MFIATSEKQHLREVEVDRLVNILLADLVQKLYEQQYDWPSLQIGIAETLGDQKKRTAPISSSFSFQRYLFFQAGSRKRCRN